MEFNVYFKEKERWINRIIEPPANSNQDFFRALKMQIIKELEIVRGEISKLSVYNCRIPRAKNKKDQIKLNILVKMRRANTLAYEQLKLILIHDDCIICEYCGGLMTKVPINVPMSKLGETYILSLSTTDGGIKYVYECPNCVYYVDEELYNQMVNWRKEKVMLIEKGIYFVPNDCGIYNWLKDKPATGQKYLVPEPIEKCDHVIDRRRIYGQDDTGKQVLKAVEDFCIECKEVTFRHIFK